MTTRTDNTLRIIVLAMCLFIVVARLLNPAIKFDACSLGALALAALISVAPAFERAAAHGAGAGGLTEDEVKALKAQLESAGLLLAESTGMYSMLRDTRPVSSAVAGAYTTLGLRLKALTEHARLESHDADAVGCLAALNAAGVTTAEQYDALMALLRTLKAGSQDDYPAGEELLEVAISVIEMLDGTLA